MKANTLSISLANPAKLPFSVSAVYTSDALSSTLLSPCFIALSLGPPLNPSAIPLPTPVTKALFVFKNPPKSSSIFSFVPIQFTDSSFLESSDPLYNTRSEIASDNSS